MKTTITNEQLIAEYRQESCPLKKEWLREDFFARNRRYAYYVAKRHRHEMIDEEDLLGFALLGMHKAFETFDLTKGIKFATYSYRTMSNEILMYFRRKGRYFQHHSLDIMISDDANDSDTTKLEMLVDENVNVEEKVISNQSFIEIIELAKEVLNDKEYVIFENMRKENGMNQRELADFLGFSQSYVSRLEKVVIRKLRGHLGLIKSVWEASAV